MREGFEARLSSVLLKSMQNAGINPNGGELKAICADVETFVKAEVEPAKVQPKEVLKEKDRPTEIPAVKTWAERSAELQAKAK